MTRLLFVLNSFESGAVPNILLDLAPALGQEGFDLRFLTLEPLPENHPSVQRCRSLGLPLVSLNKNPKDVFGSLWALASEIRRQKPDLIHSHLGRADIYSALGAPRSIPLVSTFHSVAQNYGRLTRWGYKWTNNRPAFRTGVSHESIRSLFGPGPNLGLRGPHRVVYNPVDQGRLTPRVSVDKVRRELGLDPTRPVLLSAGRFVPAKGLEYFIDALPAVLETLPHLQVILAGSGPLEGQLRTLVNHLKLEKVVRFVGFSTHLPDLMQVADLLVFPSLWEGMGLVPLEALLQGVPVVVSDIPAVAEVVENPQWRFTPRDSQACARAIVSALEDLPNRRALVSELQPSLRDRFSVSTIATQYAEIYREVL